jgi:hypothetical protein
MKPPRIPLLVAIGLAAISVTGCGDSGDAVGGLPVRLVNKSAWDAHVFGCPQCGERGLAVQGDPDRTSGGGISFGWNEKRAWPVTYKVVVRGVESVCPVIDPEPGKTEGTDTGGIDVVGTRDVIYVVDQTGKCIAGPPSMDAL